MAVTAEQLNIIIAARDREFARAMDQNVKRIERFSKQTNKGLGDASKSFDMLGNAAKRLAPLLAAAFSVQAARSAFEMAKNLDNLAAVAGVDVERFQELAVGVKQFGVEQDKLADILKDVNDKFGDYMQTGAGPLADFFDNIAPKVGLTAEQFANLSSEQKLGAYIKALEDANVSQAEMTFYMEALASDATLLQRAFADNGTAMQPMIDRARELGLILDEDMIQKGKEAHVQLGLMADVISGKLAQAFIQLAPLISGAADGIIALTQALDDFFDISPQAQEQTLLDAIAALERRLPTETDPERIKRVTDGLAQYRAELSALRGEMEAIAETPINYDNLPGFTHVGPDGLPVLTPPPRPKNLKGGKGGGGKTAIERLPPAIREATAEMVQFQTIMQSVESSIENAFMAMIDGTMSTKDAFRSMARDIIRELYRVLVVQQLVRGISSAIGLATMGLGGFYASGGTVQGGTPVVTGEHGRELFVPQQDGRIMSAAQTREMMSGGGSGVTINQVINVSTGVAQTVRTEIKSLMPEIAESAKAAVLDAKRRGGSYGRAFG